MYRAIQIYMIPITCLFKLMHCCPSVCICNTLKTSEKHSQTTTKVVCTPHSGFNIWNDILMQDMPNNTVLLVIQSPMLTAIPSFTFSNLNGLKKLDLSRNNINQIDEDAFLNLEVLEKLNLSYNKLKNFHAEIFKPLTSLMRLNLQGNLLTSLDETHVKMIPSLKFLDISNNPLVCDCRIRWLNEWIHSSNMRLPAKTLCRFPKDLQGVPLSHISEKSFHCLDYPLQLPLFELNPNVDQLVFEGDSFILRCRVSYLVPDINITWSLNGEAITLNDSVSYQLSPDSSILTSIVYIENLNTHHSGMWQCSINSSSGSSIKAVQLIAVKNNGTICSQTVTSDNKGQHVWPETPSGITVEVECSEKKSTIHQERHAYHTCTKEGFWSNLNTENCSYVSDVTNVLEHFSKMNISFTHSSALASAYLLRNYTSDYKLFNDKMDVVFASRTLQNYITAISYHPELAEIIVDVINTLLYLNSTLLIAAEAEDQSCSRLLWILEQLPDFLMDIPLNYVKENIAVEEFFVKPEGFNGIRCSSFMKNSNIYGGLIEWTSNKAFTDQDEKVLNCNIANISADAIDDNLEVEASLQLPATIFQQTDEVHNDAHKIQFIIFRNSLLFSYSGVHNSYMDITSSIISGKIAHFDGRNLSEPVMVSLRTAAYTNDVRPVWWDSQAIGGKGAWSEDGCSISKVKKNIVTFSCNKLASFGLLQNVNALMTQYAVDMAQFHFCHPAIYVGSVPCVIFLVVLLSLYCFSYKDIKMPSDTKHSIMNSFTAVIFLCIAFIFGIFQSDIIIICQVFGFILHYFTLCALLWMLVSSNNLYKKVKKYKNLYTPSSDLTPEQPLPPKPMLRFYLVGWGIPSIIVGISAAVNIENYSGKKLCFLSFKPCLGALYCPAVLVLVGVCCLYLLIFRELRQNSRHSSYPTSALGTLGAINESGNDDLECSDSREIFFSDERLLQGHATLLCLFLIAWFSGAASVTRILQNHVPYDELLLSVVYCISSLSFGMYSFTFFWWRCPAVCLSSNIFFKKNAKISKTGIEHFPMVSVAEPMLSSNVDQGALEEKMSAKDTVSAFDSSSLPATSAFTNSSNNSLDVTKLYYDPWQNVVARRFFEKCRRQKMHLFHKGGLPKTVVSTNTKLSNTSESSRALSDCRSEPSTNMYCNRSYFNKSSKNMSSSKKSPCLNFHEHPSLTSSDYKCTTMGMKSPSSEDNTFQLLELDSNIYPFARTDFPSNKKKRYKYDKELKSRNCYHHSSKLRKNVPYSSFSTEDLKCGYHCCCQCKQLCQISHKGKIHNYK